MESAISAASTEFRSTDRTSTTRTRPSTTVRAGSWIEPIGVMPGGGMSARLPRAVGVRKAKELSLTGNYLNARDAERLGLVNRVVAADQLMGAAGELARQILGADQRVVRQMKRLINLATEAPLDEGLRIEQDFFRAFNQSRDFQAVAERRAAVVERGRSQTRR